MEVLVEEKVTRTMVLTPEFVESNLRHNVWKYIIGILFFSFFMFPGHPVAISGFISLSMVLIYDVLSTLPS